MSRSGRGGGGSRGGSAGGGAGRSGGARSGGAGRSLGSDVGRAGRGMGNPGVSRTSPTPQRPAQQSPAPSRAPTPPRGGMSGAAGFGLGLGTGLAMGGRRHRRGWGWGSRRRRGMIPGGPVVHRGGGCSTFFMVIVVLVLAIAVFSFFNNLAAPNQWGAPAGPPQITQSTRVRDALPASAAIDTGPLYTDRLGWIQNSTQMQAGLRNFHNATGVRPHVYIVGEIDGSTSPTPAQVEAFTHSLYDELFSDEAHLLLVFFESGEWPDTITEIFAYPGIQARLVMDGEALDILLDYIDYYNHRFLDRGDVTEEQIFSNAFNDAAQRIMHRDPDNRAIWITVIIAAAVVLLALILFKFWKRKQVQKNLEAEQTERILNQDLDTFGTANDDEASQLAQQYNDDNENNNQNNQGV